MVKQLNDKKTEPDFSSDERSEERERLAREGEEFLNRTFAKGDAMRGLIRVIGLLGVTFALITAIMIHRHEAVKNRTPVK